MSTGKERKGTRRCWVSKDQLGWRFRFFRGKKLESERTMLDFVSKAGPSSAVVVYHLNFEGKSYGQFTLSHVDQSYFELSFMNATSYRKYPPNAASRRLVKEYHLGKGGGET